MIHRSRTHHFSDHTLFSLTSEFVAYIFPSEKDLKFLDEFSNFRENNGVWVVKTWQKMRDGSGFELFGKHILRDVHKFQPQLFFGCVGKK